MLGVVAFPELSQPIVAICGIYAGAEGAADVVQRYVGGKTQQQIIETHANAALQGMPLPSGFEHGLDPRSIALGSPDPSQSNQFVPGS